jgi:outer membrane protein insertion porin family
LDQTVNGIFDNYRYSLGGEFRVQVPVINVPFRLIFAWNPNARTEFPFFEEKRAIRFSIGRTF